MSINVNDKNLGHATAYAYYKAGGGTMTEAEFTEFMADFGTASQTAVEAAQAALASKNAAQTAATTATNKASEATTAATTATTKAGEASTSASTATSAKDTAVSASQTATTKASEATTAAATATSAATTATTAKDDAVSAKTAAQTAQTGAETAAASVQASAAQIQTNADDISELKEDLSLLSDNNMTKDITVTGSNAVAEYDYDFIAGHTYRLTYNSTSDTGGGYLKAFTKKDGNVVDIITNELICGNYIDFTATANASVLRVIAYSTGTINIYDLVGVQHKIENIKNNVDYSLLREENIKSLYDYGYIKLDYGLGTVIDTTAPISSESFKHIVYPCRKGDVFTVSGTGGSAPRAWAFLDVDYKLLSVASSNVQVSQLELTAQKDGYFVANAGITLGYNLSVKHYIVPLSEYDLENRSIKVSTPSEITWVYGYFSSSGTQNYNVVNSIMAKDAIAIKAGSKVVTTGNVQMQTYFVPYGGSAQYATYRTGEVTFDSDGTLLIGLRYSDASGIDDISILDAVTVNLVTEEKLPNVYERDTNLYGVIPANVYVGKHTDNTGMGQNTPYADAIALWRTLPSLASGYISETDLGAPYSGANHMYKYTLTPPIQGRSGKKLPHVFIVTSVHGHEKSATYGMYYLIKDMLEHAMDDPVLFYLRNYVKFTIMPMANPFGWDYNDTDLGNYGGCRYNENGININRNYGSTAWHDFDNDETYTTPWRYNARGDAPFSEPETAMIREQIANAKDVSLFIDLHTNGIDTTNKSEITYVDMNDIDNEYMQIIKTGIESYLIRNKSQMDYEYGVNLGNGEYYGTAEYPTTLNLTARAWGCETLRIPSMALEVPAGSTTGFLGNDLAKYTPSLIKLCGEMIGNYIINILYRMEQ